jgi:hypothetical protein
MEDTFPAEPEYPAVADAAQEEAEEEEEEEEEEAVAEAPPPVLPKKRGRPAGSKNRAPDVYTALLDRMTQLEETLTRRPPSSTGGTPEDPPPTTKPKRQARPRRAPAEAPPATSQVDLLMDQITQAREARRQQQLNFYATFLP